MKVFVVVFFSLSLNVLASEAVLSAKLGPKNILRPQATLALAQERTKCDYASADLVVTVTSGKTEGEPALRLVLKNYRTVVENSDRNELSFNLNDKSVGEFSLSEGNGVVWELNAKSTATPEGECKVVVKDSQEVSISCNDLVYYREKDLNRPAIAIRNLEVDRLSCRP